MPYSGLGGEVDVRLRRFVGRRDDGLNAIQIFSVKLDVIVRFTVRLVSTALVALMSDDLGVRGSVLHPRRRNDRHYRIHHRHLGHSGRSLDAQEASKPSHRLGMKLINPGLAHAENLADFFKG